MSGPDIIPVEDDAVTPGERSDNTPTKPGEEWTDEQKARYLGYRSVEQMRRALNLPEKKQTTQPPPGPDDEDARLDFYRAMYGRDEKPTKFILDNSIDRKFLPK